MADIEWILDRPVRVERTEPGRYVAAELGGERSCVLSWRDGRLCFDDADIETEDFMAYVGMLDAVDEAGGELDLEEGE
jgi:hypothetical protein